MQEAINYQNKWEKEFGDEYQSRNMIQAEERVPIWAKIINDIEFNNCLEVGASRGHNLYSIKTLKPMIELQGIEINDKAIKERFVDNIIKGSAYNMPFKDGQFELVYTAGVLIHLANIDKALEEIYRVSSKYIIFVEYYDEIDREIDYRQDVYCKARPFDKLLIAKYPKTKLLKKGENRDFNIYRVGDDFCTSCTYMVFEK